MKNTGSKTAGRITVEATSPELVQASVMVAANSVSLRAYKWRFGGARSRLVRA